MTGRPVPRSTRTLRPRWPKGQRPTLEGAAAACPAGTLLSLPDAVEGFLLSRRVGNCSARTLETYERNLRQFTAAVGGDLAACSPLAVQRYLVSLRERMRPITVRQHYRCLKTFFSWAVQTGGLADHPMRGLVMRVAQGLPRVPEDAEVRGLLVVPAKTPEGVRNRALVALLADSGLRISEALKLRIEDVNTSAGTLTVHGGKGGRDRLGFFGTRASTLIAPWLAMRTGARPVDFLFCDRQGRPLSRHHAVRILHRLSVKAGLSRRVGPHALRHYAATSLLRQTGDLELVRQVLGHSTLTMTLRYARLTGLEVAKKFHRASPLDALWTGR